MSVALRSPKFKYFNFAIETEKKIWFGETNIKKIWDGSKIGKKNR